MLEFLAAQTATISLAVTVLIAAIGGVVGLRRYKRGLDLRAAEFLLKLEEEYRIVTATCLRLEIGNRAGSVHMRSPNRLYLIDFSANTSSQTIPSARDLLLL